MGFKSATQIILSIISLVVIFTYIKPTLLDIRSTQDELFQYSDAVDKVDQLNNTLAQLLGTVGSFSSSNLAALYEYLPDTIDTVQVMADITTIADAQDMRVVSLSAGELELPQEDVILAGKQVQTKQTTSIDFDMTLNGSYGSLKAFLRALEQNKYPVEIVSLTFGNKINPEDSITEVSAIDTSNQDYQLTVRTYAYPSAAVTTK